MIKRLRVNGFKSLQGFSLRFKKGLNVLVGPNGAGKTNICQALGLAAAASQDSASEYILALGGARSVFRLCSKGSGAKVASVPVMTVSCSGQRRVKFADKPWDLAYKYSMSLTMLKGLRFRRELLQIDRVLPGKQGVRIIDARRRGDTAVSVACPEPKLVGPSVFSEKELQDLSQKPLQVRLQPNSSILESMAVLFLVGHLVREELGASRSWNIDPHVAKLPNDVSESTEMLGDGRRLARSLHQICQDKRKRKDLVEALRRIYPQCGDVKPLLSSEFATYSFEVIDDRGVQCPAIALSDGTIKGLALLTGILGGKKGMTIIEEPENYLHPWACDALVTFLRERYGQGVCIMTTHSESILNQLGPGEIVVCTNTGGITRARRIKKPSVLKKVISESGFGCGYHYVAGDLGGVPE